MGPPGQKGTVGEMGIPGKNKHVKLTKTRVLKMPLICVCVCVCVCAHARITPTVMCVCVRAHPEIAPANTLMCMCDSKQSRISVIKEAGENQLFI